MQSDHNKRLIYQNHGHIKRLSLNLKVWISAQKIGKSINRNSWRSATDCGWEIRFRKPLIMRIWKLYIWRHIAGGKMHVTSWHSYHLVHPVINPRFIQVFPDLDNSRLERRAGSNPAQKKDIINAKSIPSSYTLLNVHNFATIGDFLIVFKRSN